MPGSSEPARGADTACVMDCGDMASGRHGIPFDLRTLEPMPNEAEGEWAARPSCQRCHDVHKAGGPAGLQAYLVATRSLREALAIARTALRSIAGKAIQTVDEIGENPWP